MTSFARRNWRAQSVVETCLLFLKLLRGTMPKTPTTERETATFRLPAALLERARRDGTERGLAYVRSVEEALEVYFFARLPPPMAEALEQELLLLAVGCPVPADPGERARQGGASKEEVGRCTDRHTFVLTQSPVAC